MEEGTYRLSISILEYHGTRVLSITSIDRYMHSTVSNIDSMHDRYPISIDLESFEIDRGHYRSTVLVFDIPMSYDWSTIINISIVLIDLLPIDLQLI